MPGKRVLHDVSVYANPGQKIAFVGSTGAGKTTITNLINRFYEVTQGVITYDGIDVRRIRKDDLRHSLGVVLQDSFIFSGTIMDNIRYGRLDATDEEVQAAARAVRAHDFIMEMDRGYYTEVNERGSRLSQGQRQLISFARTLLSDPKILILDEATSSIDTKTERCCRRGSRRCSRGGPPLSSPTGCPPCATPTASWSSSTARSRRRATTSSCWQSRAGITACTPARFQLS